MTRTQRIMLLIGLSPATVLAGNAPPVPVPEPGVLSLLGLGVAVAVAIAIKKRR